MTLKHPITIKKIKVNGIFDMIYTCVTFKINFIVTTELGLVKYTEGIAVKSY